MGAPRYHMVCVVYVSALHANTYEDTKNNKTNKNNNNKNKKQNKNNKNTKNNKNKKCFGRGKP